MSFLSSLCGPSARCGRDARAPRRRHPGDAITLRVARKSVGAPPSRLRRSTNAESSSSIASSIGGGSSSARTFFQMALARCTVLTEPRSSQLSKVAPVAEEGTVERGLVTLPGVLAAEEVPGRRRARSSSACRFGQHRRQLALVQISLSPLGVPVATRRAFSRLGGQKYFWLSHQRAASAAAAASVSIMCPGCDTTAPRASTRRRASAGSARSVRRARPDGARRGGEGDASEETTRAVLV